MAKQEGVSKYIAIVRVPYFGPGAVPSSVIALFAVGTLCTLIL